MTLTPRCLQRLVGVHADLVRVTHRAAELSRKTFRITEGVRSLERQQELVAAGKSKTLNSRHLTGHAVDVVVLDDKGHATWAFADYQLVAACFKQAAAELQVPIVWGGDWQSFRDGPHFELDRKHYP